MSPLIIDDHSALRGGFSIFAKTWKICFLFFFSLPCLVCVAWSTFAAVENAVEDSTALHGEIVMEVSPLDNDLEGLEACNCKECFLNCKYCCNFPRLAAATISARISGGKMYSEPLADALLSDVRLVSNLKNTYPAALCVFSRNLILSQV